MKKKRLNISSDAKWEADVGYSRAVRVGNIIEVSGTAAVRYGEIIGIGSPYEQAVFIIKKIEKALHEAGGKLNDIVRTRIYVTDISRWEEVGKAHGEFFREIKPATTIVEVKSFIDPTMLVEIEATAVVD